MPKHKETKVKRDGDGKGGHGVAIGLATVGVLVVVLLPAGFLNNWWAAPPPAVVTTTPAGYSLNVKDGITGAARNTTALTVYNTTDPANWAAYVSTWTGVSQDELNTTGIAQIVQRKGTATNFYLLATAP